MSRKDLRGYLYILSGTTLWGVSGTVAKSLFNMGLPPSELILIRLTISTFLLLCILLFLSPRKLFIAFKDVPYFLILGFGGVGALQYANYLTISKIQVGAAVLIQYLGLIWISLYAFLFQREPLSKWKILSLILALIGCYLVVGGYRIDLLRLNRVGIVSGVACSLVFAFYTLFGEKGLRKYDPWTLIFYGFGFGAVLYWILFSPSKVITSGYSLKIWIAFLFIAIFSTVIPFGFYFRGIERIRATRASIASTWEPVVASFTAFFVLGEVLYPLQISGGIMVMAAVVLLQIGREKAEPSSALEIRQREKTSSPNFRSL